MEDALRQLYQERASDANTLGILLVEKSSSVGIVTDHFDAVLLLIVKNGEEPWYVKHYEYNAQKIALHIIDEKQLSHWLITSGNRIVVDWTINGKVIFDRNEFIANLKVRLEEFPVEDRKRKMLVEYAKLIRRFYEGKDLFHSGNYLDAFNNVMHSLHHLARLGIVEHGYYPEVTVWKQVKKIEPEIFKLYDELVTGDETIEKRLELLLLANEFAITSKIKVGSIYLLEVMEGKDGHWSYAELMKEFDLKNDSTNLSVLLEHLVQKGFIDIVKEETKSKGIYHRLYKVNDKHIKK